MDGESEDDSREGILGFCCRGLSGVEGGWVRTGGYLQSGLAGVTEGGLENAGEGVTCLGAEEARAGPLGEREREVGEADIVASRIG